MLSPSLQRHDLLLQAVLIGGEWIGASAGTRISVTNPATGETLGSVPDVGEEGVQAAIAAAEQAFSGWRKRNARERSALLLAWYQRIMAHQDDLALLMTLEQGKPLKESRGEIAYAASFLRWFAEEAPRDSGRIVPSASGVRTLVLQQPVGICGLITPWNFPAAMITRKAGPALAAGCSVVIKPASQTPFTALALARLGEEAGIPAGVLNVVTGKASTIGRTLCEDDRVRKLSFTGSTEVGRLLMRQSADTVKRVSMELGGNAPFIVFADADLDAAVSGAIASKFRNSGQTCICANRFLVEASIYDAFAEKLAAKAAALKVGNGWESGIEQGPLIDMAAVEKVERLLAEAVQQGASVMTGGSRHALGGQFFQPTVLRDATAEMTIFREEIFGPVAALYRFEGEEEAIALANRTEYGLASYAYTRSQARCWRLAEQLETGMLGLNTGLISTESAPFGGVKHSGVGREGGAEGLAEYTEPVYVCLSLPE